MCCTILFQSPSTATETEDFCYCKSIWRKTTPNKRHMFFSWGSEITTAIRFLSTWFELSSLSQTQGRGESSIEFELVILKFLGYLPGAGWKASSKSLSVGSGIYRRTTLPSLLGNPFCNKGQRVCFIYISVALSVKKKITQRLTKLTYH